MSRLSEAELAVLGELFFLSIGCSLLPDAAARERTLKRLAAKGYARFEGDPEGVRIDLHRALDALEGAGFPELVPADAPALAPEKIWSGNLDPEAGLLGHPPAAAA